MMDTITLKILVDNNAKDGFIKEHGFSLWIEAFNHKIIFDTGQGEALIPNAEKLSIDLTLADSLVLSHGHYDHTGNVELSLNNNSHCKAYAHPDVLFPRYSIGSANSSRDVSIPLDDKKALTALSSQRMCWTISPLQIESCIGVTGAIPRLHPLENTGGPFYIDPEAQRPDLINDDIALWITTLCGVIIVTGCCHSGIINTVEYIKQISGEQRVLGIIGGLHLLNASQERLDATMTQLKKWNPEFIIPCHCTGNKTVGLMQKEFGEKIILGYAGLEWKLSNNN